jgi:hypothetical protein
MKADRTGTPAEQKRFAEGWLTPTERQRAPDHGDCKTCRSFSPPIGGKGEFCSRHGFSTRRGARCRAYGPRVAA